MHIVEEHSRAVMLSIYTMIITECHMLPTRSREDTGSGQGQRLPGQCDVS